MLNQVSAIIEQTMSSVEIAKLTGKQHAHVLRDIRTMIHELDDPTLDHKSLTLVSGYSIKVRHAIIKRWQELESTFAKPTNACLYFKARDQESLMFVSKVFGLLTAGS